MILLLAFFLWIPAVIDILYGLIYWGFWQYLGWFVNIIALPIMEVIPSLQIFWLVFVIGVCLCLLCYQACLLCLLKRIFACGNVWSILLLLCAFGESYMESTIIGYNHMGHTRFGVLFSRCFGNDCHGIIYGSFIWLWGYIYWHRWFAHGCWWQLRRISCIFSCCVLLLMLWLM